MIRDRDLVDDENDETVLRHPRPCVICRQPTTNVVLNYGTLRGYSAACRAC
jgi:hypothetical protein